MVDGREIMVGIVEESNKNYHANKESLSKSNLEKMKVCPQYFKWCLDNPQEPTEDLVVGSAFHKATLEQETFGQEFVVMPNINRRTKEGKEQYNLFVEASKGRGVITEEQYENILCMRKAVLENKYARVLLDGEHEKSFYAIDEMTGERIKARPDCYRFVQDRIVITDLKSCKSAMTDDFMRDVVKYGYDLQAYMYSYIVSQVTQVPMENIDFVFIAVEKKSPYLINILQADRFVFERGESLFRRYIGDYHDCKESGVWWGLNGRSGVINTLSLPNYLLNKGE